MMLQSDGCLTLNTTRSPYHAPDVAAADPDSHLSRLKRFDRCFIHGVTEDAKELRYSLAALHAGKGRLRVANAPHFPSCRRRLFRLCKEAKSKDNANHKEFNVKHWTRTDLLKELWEIFGTIVCVNGITDASAAQRQGLLAKPNPFREGLMPSPVSLLANQFAQDQLRGEVAAAAEATAQRRAADRGVSAENITAGLHGGRIFRPHGLPTAREATADRRKAASTEYELKSVALILHLAMAALEDSSERSSADFVKNGTHRQPAIIVSVSSSTLCMLT